MKAAARVAQAVELTAERLPTIAGLFAERISSPSYSPSTILRTNARSFDRRGSAGSIIPARVA
jgi:hypothetical protein